MVMVSTDQPVPETLLSDACATSDDTLPRRGGRHVDRGGMYPPELPGPCLATADGVAGPVSMPV